MRVEEITLDEWGSILPDSGFEVFHLPEALSVLAEHASGELRLFAGYKGDHAVAMLPVFVRELPVGTVVQSPPAATGVPRLGPVLMPNSPKRRKQEKLNQTFTESVVDQLELDSSLTIFRMLCNTAYQDPRPFTWSDLQTETLFTYCLDTSSGDLDEIRSSFSRSLRREMRDAADLDITVEVEDIDGTRAVHDDSRARYEEQDETYELEWSYVRDLAKALDDRCRSYVARAPDGQYISGITVLYSNDMAYFWQGGTRSIYRDVSVNGLLHWRILEDIVTDESLSDVGTYDLMGANTERLCQYKSKFGAELVPYYLVETKGAHVDVAKRAYEFAMK